MSARNITIRFGAIALATVHLYCASEAPPPAADPSVDAGVDAALEGDAAPAEPDAEPPPWLACNETFCRVSLPGAETVALDGLFAQSPSDVWVVGSGGYAAHFDGKSWRQIPTRTKATLYAVARSEDGTVWATSGGDSFFKLSREGGVEVEDAGFKGVVRAIATFGTRDAYAVGNEFDTFFDPPPSGFIWRYGPNGPDATWGWHPVSPPCPLDEFGWPACITLHAVWVESAQRVWFAGEGGTIFRSDGFDDDGRLRLVETSSSTELPIYALWGFGAHDIWAVGAQGTIRRFVGGDAWTVVKAPVERSLYGIWGSRPDDVWAVGDDGLVLHWDGEAWTVVPTPYGEENRPRLYAVSGSGNDVWIAGETTLLRSRSAGGEP